MYGREWSEGGKGDEIIPRGSQLKPRRADDRFLSSSIPCRASLSLTYSASKALSLRPTVQYTALYHPVCGVCLTFLQGEQSHLGSLSYSAMLSHGKSAGRARSSPGRCCSYSFNVLSYEIKPSFRAIRSSLQHIHAPFRRRSAITLTHTTLIALAQAARALIPTHRSRSAVPWFSHRTDIRHLYVLGG